jgi:hypothetical protein
MATYLLSRELIMNPINTGVGRSGAGTVLATGVFSSYVEARQAIEALRRAGYRDDQIGVLGPNERRHEEPRSGLPNDPTHTRWEEGTGIGAATGGIAGLGLGAAIAAGLISPLGPVLAGGTLVALLASAGAGATVGTVVGGLIGLGIPEEEAHWYASELEAGRVVVTVQDAGTAAGEILNTHGAKSRSSPSTAVPGNALPATPY